ncbi:hypothetical protein V492_07350 [Pseudogymnoascus sp. VKM F-4246]|nr:hypothetical protein V492_07350 [Pseudogymnoascus sp. VKM F-4246]
MSFDFFAALFMHPKYVELAGKSIAPTCAINSHTESLSVSDSILFLATISSVHRISGQPINRAPAAPTGINGYFPKYHGTLSIFSFVNLDMSMGRYKARKTQLRANIESEICQTRINLCQPGDSVRHPKKKNWYTPYPSGCAKAQKYAHVQISRGHAAELVSADGAKPDDLGVPVVGEEANVARAVVSETGVKLCGGEHEAGIEKPTVGEAEAIYDGDGRHCRSATVTRAQFPKYVRSRAKYDESGRTIGATDRLCGTNIAGPAIDSSITAKNAESRKERATENERCEELRSRIKNRRAKPKSRPESPTREFGELILEAVERPEESKQNLSDAAESGYSAYAPMSGG